MGCECFLQERILDMMTALLVQARVEGKDPVDFISGAINSWGLRRHQDHREVVQI
jgi:hypothetical protein